uniref:MARVEL domain-containing protein n=1 Tax=Plectus sambesii TaxID=2011161 RepID=A0A914XDP0_9BILA
MLLSFKHLFIAIRGLTFFFFVLVWVCILCEDYWKTNEKAEAALGLAVIGNIVFAVSLGLLVADMSTMAPRRLWICVISMMALLALVAGVLVATQANSCRPDYCVNSGMYAAAAAFSFFAFFSIVADLVIMVFFSKSVY